MSINGSPVPGTGRGTLIIIAGPTGSGKTDFSVELASRLGCPVISADSRQVFRGLAIGTAQPTAEQLRQVSHYFIADRDVTENYTSGKFEKEALALLEKLFAQNPYVIATGGSGLYIDALCSGFDDLPTENKQLRAQFEEQIRDQGLAPLLERLEKLDPVYFGIIDKNNPARVMRALEVCLSSGKPYSELRSGAGARRPFDIIKFGLDMPRPELYGRINRRVDMMMEQGLEQEARNMLPYRSFNSLQTVGYREMFDYFDGKISRDEAVALIKRNSRRYAKRQLTWFRRDEGIKWVGKNDIDSVENYIKKFAEL